MATDLVTLIDRQIVTIQQQIAALAAARAHFVSGHWRAKPRAKQAPKRDGRSRPQKWTPERRAKMSRALRARWRAWRQTGRTAARRPTTTAGA